MVEHPAAGPFEGFREQALEFYAGLEAENSKAYWQAHRETYETEVAQPLAALAAHLEPEFGAVKVFRPYRDVRFSKDKSPYQLHASCAAEGHEGVGSLYLQLGLDGLLLAGGWWHPDTAVLTRFRRAVDDPSVARSFDRCRDALAADGLELDGFELKTAPRGWDRDHPRMDLLRLRSLAFSSLRPAGPWLDSPECLEVVTSTWRSLGRANRWLAEHVGAGD
ncbi:TIGR02453 family protein [Kineococcus sp. R8]|uniref:DUF2461 domain-containing protein n=1 Tax=Kineococcus siccus TaxID=2696567 RepID=UPI001412DC0E|nr:DUF2461 domain-containing protein [Kineococcus siccus]NAZ81340.1 TIGR02453 family protein [Kineococcus siccus]